MLSVAHTGFVVSDCDRSEVFYKRVLGCETADCFEDQRVKIVFLQAGNGTLELVQYKGKEDDPRQAGVVDHLAFSVTDIAEEISRLKELGVTFLMDAPREVLGGRKMIFFAGPDGERLELIQ
jgi:lactoylglutathione lyase